MTMQVELVSPEHMLWSGEAVRVIARTLGGGDIAFLTGHAPFLGALDVYPVRILTSEGTEEVAAVHGGFVQVTGEKITILSDVAELAGQIDVDRARAAESRAEAKVRDTDDAEAVAALARANARLHAAGAAGASAAAHH